MKLEVRCPAPGGKGRTCRRLLATVATSANGPAPRDLRIEPGVQWHADGELHRLNVTCPKCNHLITVDPLELAEEFRRAALSSRAITATTGVRDTGLRVEHHPEQ